MIVVAVNRMPAAEDEVSADLVRRLLADQHLDLARLPVEFLANGWDNELYRVGDGLVGRLPRRALGAEIIKNALSASTSRCPLPISRTNCPDGAAGEALASGVTGSAAARCRVAACARSMRFPAVPSRLVMAMASIRAAG